MGYRTIYIQHSERLSLYLDNLKVHQNDKDLLIPLADIQMLIIDNYKLTLSIQLINKLSDYNVSVITCGLDHLPRATILSCHGHHAQSGVIMQQIAWDDQKKEELRQLIVKAKVQNQIKILQKNNCKQEVIDKMDELEKGVEKGDKTNREGLAAKLYFKELFGKKFIRFNEDGINAGLNYGYAVFRSHISTVITSKGLLTNLGLFHIGKTNHFNLSDDLIEVYRPIVDDYVLKHMSMDDELTFEHKTGLIELISKKVLIENKFQTINNSVSMYIDSIIQYFNNERTDIIYPSSIIFDGL